MAREAENGKSGTVFRAPTGNVTFRVPEGWNLVSSANGVSVFQSDDGGILSVGIKDLYAHYTEAVMSSYGITREGFDNSWNTPWTPCAGWKPFPPPQA